MNIREEIDSLREEKDVVIVAHNYQEGLIQDVADYVGDSLGLAMKVKQMDVPNVIFCGVDFMAESAAILNPDKSIIHPEPDARCPMAEMVDIDELKEYKDDNPDTAIVSYVNTNVETKALSDICCTSSNAVKIVESLPERDVMFTPDKNLGDYIKRFVDKKNIEIWEGYCRTHDKISPDDVKKTMERHPEAEVVVHPECRPEVIDLADFTESTAGILRRAKESRVEKMIIGTEKEMGYRLRKEAPEKEYYFPGNPICQNMKKITPEKVLRSLEELKPIVDIEESLAEKAREPLKKMIEMGRG